MAGTSWPDLIPGRKARASDVDARFQWLEGDIVPMNGGVTTDASYDIGTSANRWQHGYFIELGLDDNAAITFVTGGSIQLLNGVSVNEFSNDGTLAGDSDLAVPTEKAVKTYVDTILTPAVFRAELASTTAISTSTTPSLQFTPTSDPYNEMTGSVFTAATSGTYEFRFRHESNCDGGGSLAQFGYYIVFKKNSSVAAAYLNANHNNQSSLSVTSSVAFYSDYHSFLFSMSAGDTMEIGAQTVLGSPSIYRTSPSYFFGDTTTTNIHPLATELVIQRR